MVLVTSCDQDSEEDIFVNADWENSLELSIRNTNSLVCVPDPNFSIRVWDNAPSGIAIQYKTFIALSEDNPLPTTEDSIRSTSTVNFSTSKVISLPVKEATYYARAYYRTTEGRVVYSEVFSFTTVLRFNNIRNSEDQNGIRNEAVIATQGDEVYILTGASTRFPDSSDFDLSVNRFDFDSKTFLDHGSLSELGIEPRIAGFSLSFDDNKTFIGGGTEDARSIRLLDDFWALDLNNMESTLLSPLPVPFTGAVSFTLEGQGYVGGGLKTTEHSPGDVRIELTDDLFRYDPIMNEWEQLNPLPLKVSTAISFNIDGTIYMGSGSDGSGLRDDFYSYDHLSDTWTQLTSMPLNTSDAVGLSHNEKGYVIGGVSTENVIQEYDPISDSWTIFCISEEIDEGIGFTARNQNFVGLGLHSDQILQFLD